MISLWGAVNFYQHRQTKKKAKTRHVLGTEKMEINGHKWQGRRLYVSDFKIQINDLRIKRRRLGRV